jgi:hypothetical protein
LKPDDSQVAVKVRRTTEQTIPEDLAQGPAELAPNIRALTAQFAGVTKRLELGERRRSQSRRDEERATVVHQTDDASEAIEYVTDNGFSIVRPWESGYAPKPTGGACRFAVTDEAGREHQVNVKISERLISEIALRTRGRIHLSSSFWICCAERHLANYVWERDEFPVSDNLTVENLDPEEVMLALRWGASG